MGVPLLADCPNRIVVQRIALLDEGGDHVCITGGSISVEAGGTFTPLRLSQAEHLTPGHENDERNNPPTERSSEL